MTQRPETMPEKDAIDLLIRQHEEIRSLFEEVDRSTGHAREEAFEKLCRFLAVHETAEEEVVHPLARRVIPDGDRIIDARLEEENEGKRVLQALEKMGTSAAGFEPLFAEFRKSVLEHAENEEREEFTRLREMGGTELRGLAAAIKAAEAMAPTHPHPGVESAAKNILIGTFASAADRTRDVVRKALGRDRK
ncbi:hemerythrin domain-containing protein [Actinoallomurus sp. NPDC052274]|uniref:hemerythrin domain-containing protein n=1 Tax=Actinoallomurus sp. NPDC052274 TaxID=3155420 RepID=UPI003449B8FE